MCDVKYQAILALPHHVSSSRRHMNATERAAQFAPFAALTGYDDAIAETARLTESKARLGDWEQAEMDEKLRFLAQNVRDHPAIAVTYFRPDEKKNGGAYVTACGTLKKIKLDERELLLSDGTAISLDAVRRLTGECFSPLEY